ncbi:MAG: hypothetical protein WCQ64_09395, partial [Acidobacteriota bacterium]
MRASVLGLAVLTLGLISFSASGLSAQRSAPVAPAKAAAAPCTTATPECTEWVALKSSTGGPARSMVYTTYSLDKANAGITRALIMVHGTN